MRNEELTEEQLANGRLAEALRDLAGDFDKIGDVEVARAGDIPIVWPASNIKETLHEAADLIEKLILGDPR